MFLYIAGKYAGKDEAEKMANVGVAKQIAIELWNDGHAVLCPHLNTFDFEYYTNLENRDFVNLDLLMVERCDGIVMAPNWEDSRGAIHELDHAKIHGLKVYYWPDKPHWKTIEKFEKERNNV